MLGMLAEMLLDVVFVRGFRPDPIGNISKWDRNGGGESQLSVKNLKMSGAWKEVLVLSLPTVTHKKKKKEKGDYS